MTDADDAFARLNQETQIWDALQFTVPDVCNLTGATAKALEHFVDPSRGLVRLMGNHANPGKGKRRLFTGGQVLMIKAAFVMNRIGFPQRWSIYMCDDVLRRARAQAIGLAANTEMTLVTYPLASGDWAVVPLYAEMTDMPKLPVCFQALDVDRLISETKAQLEAVISGEDIPDFSIPEVQPEPNPYSPKSNFFKMWVKDAAGNWLLVGLTLEETKEYMALRGMALDGDDLTYFEVDRDPDKLDRSIELDQKHELARAIAMGMQD